MPMIWTPLFIIAQFLGIVDWSWWWLGITILCDSRGTTLYHRFDKKLLGRLLARG